MQYLLMIYGNEAGMQAAAKDEVAQMSAAYVAYTEAMKQGRRACAAASGCARPPRPPPCGSRTARPRCSTAPMPTPRSSSAATT